MQLICGLTRNISRTWGISLVFIFCYTGDKKSVCFVICLPCLKIKFNRRNAFFQKVFKIEIPYPETLYYIRAIAVWWVSNKINNSPMTRKHNALESSLHISVREKSDTI